MPTVPQLPANGLMRRLDRPFDQPVVRTTHIVLDEPLEQPHVARQRKIKVKRCGWCGKPPFGVELHPSCADIKAKMQRLTDAIRKTV